MDNKKLCCAVALAGAMVSTSAQAFLGLQKSDFAKENFYFKAGATQIAPDVDSGPLEFYGLNDTAQAALDEGPYPGTGTDVSTETMPSLTVGWILPWGNRHWSVETILAPPFEFEFYATGVARYQSLAPEAYGIPTDVPALGKTLGKTKMLPPTVTLVYSFMPESKWRPYLGLGATYVYSFDEEITNPVLTEIREPDVEISETFAWVAQAGIDVDITKNFFFGLDVKYVGDAKVEAEVTDIELATSMDLLFPVAIDRNVVEQELNPTIYQITLGYRF